METTLACNNKGESDCTGTCAYVTAEGPFQHTCDIADTGALPSLMSSAALALAMPAYVCTLDTACASAACAKGDTCFPSTAAIDEALSHDKVMAAIMAGLNTVTTTAPECHPQRFLFFLACGSSLCSFFRQRGRRLVRPFRQTKREDCSISSADAPASEILTKS